MGQTEARHEGQFLSCQRKVTAGQDANAPLRDQGAPGGLGVSVTQGGETLSGVGRTGAVSTLQGRPVAGPESLHDSVEGPKLDVLPKKNSNPPEI